MEPDFLPDSEILVLAGCIPQENCTPLHVGGCGGDLSPPQGPGGLPPRLGGPGASSPPAWISRVAPPKLKIDVKLRCKIIVISIQSGSFIRRMI